MSEPDKYEKYERVRFVFHLLTLVTCLAVSVAASFVLYVLLMYVAATVEHLTWWGVQVTPLGENVALTAFSVIIGPVYTLTIGRANEILMGKFDDAVDRIEELDRQRRESRGGNPDGD